MFDEFIEITKAKLEKESAEECYSKLAINNDYEMFWDAVFEYADKNLRIDGIINGYN